ncbi:hypothetical protein NA78x_000152 [Anatilimnocola sp. NA78]|uniref:hypothetical protein n=1 Tax=Anatilimnocola sp. NA78 TaxID=3415683 RepID=UPI003CE4A687
MTQANVIVDAIPLLDKLRSLEPEIERRFPKGPLHGLDVIGLNLVLPYKHGGYEHSPQNTRMFAETRGDGTHFSFLSQNGKIDAASPVVMTEPSGFANVIVGKSFRDFLCFGLIRGYFFMEQLVYSPADTLAAYNSANWQDPSGDDWPSENSRNVLAFIADSLELQPLAYSPAEFQAMQDALLPQLDLPPNLLKSEVRFSER